MKRAAVLLTLSLVLALAAPLFAAPIHLKSRTIEGGDTVVPWAALSDHAGRHVLVQLAYTPTADQRDFGSAAVSRFKESLRATP